MHSLQVASVPGGLELMLCAGFKLEDSSPQDASPRADGGNVDANVYLKHSGNADTEAYLCLQYMLVR